MDSTLSGDATPRPLGPLVYPDVTHDAVVVIPGIMGSALRDTATGQIIWGLTALGWYREAWTSGKSLNVLATREHGRIEAIGLLRFPAWAPLGYFEPYGNLIAKIYGMVAHRDAVLEFAYDWRQPVLDNARLLARAARAHLDTWRAHPRHDQAREVQPDQRPAQLVLVAHSMGGLLARALPLVEGSDSSDGPTPMLAEDIRATITLGTPFRGAAKAAVLLGDGQGVAGLPRRRLTRLVRTMPGIYDLLPTYRCVDTGDDIRHLTAADLATLGGDRNEAERTFAFHHQMAELSLVAHRALVGVEQPTVSLLRLHGGLVEALRYTFDVNTDGTLVRDRHGIPVQRPSTGDATVPDTAGDLPDVPVEPLAQQHGALGHVDEVVTFVRWVLTRKRPGGRLGSGNRLGIDTPDVVAPGVEWAVMVSGVDGPNEANCQVIDAETGTPIDAPGLQWRDSGWQFVTCVPMERLYRVVVTAAGRSPLVRVVLATSPETDAGDDIDE